MKNWYLFWHNRAVWETCLW